MVPMVSMLLLAPNVPSGSDGAYVPSGSYGSYPYVCYGSYASYGSYGSYGSFGSHGSGVPDPMAPMVHMAHTAHLFIVPPIVHKVLKVSIASMVPVGPPGSWFRHKSKESC